MALASVYLRGSSWYLGYSGSTGIKSIPLPVKSEEEAREFLASIVSAVTRMEARFGGAPRAERKSA